MLYPISKVSQSLHTQFEILSTMKDIIIVLSRIHLAWFNLCKHINGRCIKLITSIDNLDRFIIGAVDDLNWVSRALSQFLNNGHGSSFWSIWLGRSCHLVNHFNTHIHEPSEIVCVDIGMILQIYLELRDNVHFVQHLDGCIIK